MGTDIHMTVEVRLPQRAARGGDAEWRQLQRAVEQDPDDAALRQRFWALSAYGPWRLGIREWSVYRPESVAHMHAEAERAGYHVVRNPDYPSGPLGEYFVGTDPELPLWGERAYRVFGVLAGVRNYRLKEDDKTISLPRGLPRDRPGVDDDMFMEEPGDHSFTWLLASEVLEDSQGRSWAPPEFWHMVDRWAEKYGPRNARFVFGFDN